MGSGLVVRRILRAGLVGALDGIERMLRREHSAGAGRTVNGELAVLDAVFIQPVKHLSSLVRVHADELLVRLAAEIIAVVDDISHVGLNGIFDAVFLLNDGARSGHGTAGIIERAAGLGGHFKHDNLLSALSDSFKRSRQAGAAGADDHNVRIRFLGSSRENEAAHQHRHSDQQRNQLLHGWFPPVRLVKWVMQIIHECQGARKARPDTGINSLLSLTL